MKSNYVFFLSILYLTVVLLISSCEPEIGFGGQGTIHGTVMMPDSLSSTSKVLPNADVFLIFNSKNLAEYNFKRATDLNGYYSFPYLRKDKGWYYIISVHDVVRNGKKTTYTAIDSVKADSESLDGGSVLRNLNLKKSIGTGDRVLSGRIYINNLLKEGVEIAANATIEVISEGINPKYRQTIQTDASGFFLP